MYDNISKGGQHMSQVVDDRAGFRQCCKEVKSGETFMYNGSVYMLTDMIAESRGNCIAVNLESGCAAEFIPDDMVQPVTVVHHIVQTW